MKDPLRKRLPRELRSEFGKYLVVFVMMTALAAVISGFLVVDGSVLAAYNESFEKYRIEDGHLIAAEELTDGQKEELTDCGVTLYENLYVEQDFDNGTAIRIFADRTEVNLVCLMSGKMPQKAGEIALDRMYAQNNALSVGDVITAGEERFTVTGLVALSDYSALFQNNSDMMFDSLQFGVAVVSREGFEALNADRITWEYSWIWDQAPKSEREESEIAEDFMKAAAGIVSLKDFTPRYQNQAINFTGEDMGSDKAMMIMVLYIIIAILAFVFGVTISSTIAREAAVIGTLRASGYTRGELIRHYMTLPILVTLAGALLGNVLGYTVMIGLYEKLYYNSYSLTTYRTLWSSEAFWLTTAVPILIMLAVNYGILKKKLGLPILNFLRRDISRRKNRRAFALSPRLPIFRRFRIRVVFQNVSSYLVMLIGIFMANVLLIWGLGLPAVLDNYQAEVTGNLLANYQYMLSVPVSLSGGGMESVLEAVNYVIGTKTDNPDAEKFSAYALQTVAKGAQRTDEITLYGVQEESRYVPIDFSGDGVCISSAYADKYGLKAGDEITLKEAYADDTYTFSVDGVYGYDAALCVFMPRKELNQTFGLDEDYFGGYFCDTKITDLREKYVGTVIDADALTKVSRQLDVSMGDMMGVINVFAVIIFLVVVYLLSKVIIEKNAQSISMAKILGYSDAEIARLYMVSTSVVVVLSILVSIPLTVVSMEWLFRVMMLYMMTGWITLYLPSALFAEVILTGICAYAAVAVLEFRRIRRIPMTDALKTVE